MMVNRIIAVLFAAFTLIACSTASSQVKSASPAPDTVAQASPTFPCSAAGRIGISKTVLFVDANEGKPGEYKLAKTIPWPTSGLQELAPNPDKDAAYIFLLTRWQISGTTYSLKSSAWYVYRPVGTDLVESNNKNSSNGVLLPYGFKSAVVVGVQIVDFSGTTANAVINYTVSASQGNKQNVTNLGAILGTIAGVAIPKSLRATQTEPVCAQMYAVRGTPELPFNLNVSFTLTPGNTPKIKPSNASSAIVDCSSTTSDQGCTIARSFSAVDKEWWDVSVGLNAFGTRQPSFDSKGARNGATRNVDPYLFVNGFPAFWWLPKDSPLPINGLHWLAVPHVDAGIPVKKQPLHRPFFGLSERIWKTEKLFSVPVYFTGGVVRLIEDVPNGTGGTRQHVVWKSMFGFEFSGSALASKLTGK